MKTERRLTSRLVSTVGTLVSPNRTQQEGPPIITEGLVGHWDAGNPYSYLGTGTTWTDLSGSGNNGTLTNGPTFSADRGGIINFDGTNDYVATSISTTVTSATFLIWLYRNGTQIDWTGLMFSRSTNVTGVNLRSNTNQIGYHWNGEGNTTYNWVSNLVIPNLEWCMAAVTVTPTVATAYLCTANGVTSATNTATHSSSTINALELCRDSFVTRVFKGGVGTSLLYNRALSAAEVFQNYQATRWRFNV